MAQLAHERAGEPVWLEFSIRNADKPVISAEEICRRLVKSIVGHPPHPSLGPMLTLRPHGLVITRAATFLAKARLFPGSLFVVGTDTLQRIGDPKFYDANPQQRDAAIAEIADLGSRFLVFGRAPGRSFSGPCGFETAWPAVRYL